MVGSLPGEIWQEPWVCPTPAPSRPIYRMEGFTRSVFEAATEGLNPMPVLNVEGLTLDAVADQFTEIIDEAGRNNDYSQVLSPNRFFAM